MPTTVIPIDGMNPIAGDPPLSSKMDPVDAMARTIEDARRTGDGASMGKSGFGCSSTFMGVTGVTDTGSDVGISVVSSSVAEKSDDGDDDEIRATLFTLALRPRLEEMENADT